jgi:hypothetical protein
MSDISSTVNQTVSNQQPRWRELWLKEDWWAVWIGLGLVIAGFALFASGSNINWIAVAPAKWSTFSELGAGLSANALRYAAQFGVFLVVFTRDLPLFAPMTGYVNGMAFTCHSVRAAAALNG